MLQRGVHCLFLHGAIMAVHTHGVTRAGGWKDRSSTIIPPPLPSLPLLDYWSDLTLYVAHDYQIAPNIVQVARDLTTAFFFSIK